MKNRIWIFVLILAGFCALSVPASAEIWHGLYTDATSYAPGDTIKVYASAPEQKMVIRLVKLDTEWTEVVRSAELDIGPQSSYVGSFIEYPGTEETPGLTLGGRTSFTLEGWFHPTLLGGDTAVVAGQIGMTEAAAGIIITEEGEFAAYVSDTAQRDPARLAIAPIPTEPPDGCDGFLDCWYHLALTYDINAEDGIQVKLYVNGELEAYRSQTGPVAEVAAPFRLGARSEAPGDDLTGIVDGRLDSWALWPIAKSDADIVARMNRGLNEDDPAPDPEEVDFYAGFEGPYPSVNDSSHNSYTGTAVNHGNPGVAGVYGEGRAFRLNHDQIVNAGWGVTTELLIPPGTPSGMYAVQTLPAIAPTQDGNWLSARAIAVRPAADGPRAPIAVVLPTNTWTAYTAWPGTKKDSNDSHWLMPYGPATITPRSRLPNGPTPPKGGGNNAAAYNKMGDGESIAYYHGWQRPSREASPLMTGSANYNAPFMTGAAVGNYSVRSANSMYLVQWLDAQGFAYDVYSDDDFDSGLILASDHRVLMPHSHHEYWSDGMIESLTRFLDGGGSVVAPAGNIFTWRVVYGPNRLVETRKFGKAPVLGLADMLSGIDGSFMGSLKNAAICNEGNDYYDNYKYQALGVVIHHTSPCKDEPFCFGQWAARNTGHWLWDGSGLSEDERFGYGRNTDSFLDAFAVGHEADTWVEGMPLPGLVEGQQAVILAEGRDFDLQGTTGGFNNLLDANGELVVKPEPTCEQQKEAILTGSQPSGKKIVPPKAGTILYFPHSGGGNVLVIGASATPWALESDNALSGLMWRALSCFAYDDGCPQEAIPGDLDGDGDVDRNDLSILLRYRNQPADGCPECDLDGDGRITVLDARRLVVMCTRSRCAT